MTRDEEPLSNVEDKGKEEVGVQAIETPKSIGKTVAAEGVSKVADGTKVSERSGQQLKNVQGQQNRQQHG